MRKNRNKASIINAISHAIKNTVKHDGMEFAGYLAYLWLLSLFPFLFIYTAILGNVTKLIFDKELYQTITQKLIIIFDTNIPENIIRGIMPFIQEVLSGPSHSLLTIVILSAIWTSSSTFEGMRTIFNRAHRIRNSPKYMWGRMISILQLLFITAISILLLVLLTVVPMFEDLLLLSPIIEIQTYLKYLYTIITLLVILCWLYLVIPNESQSLRSVLPGASIVVFLWIVTAYLFSLYISYFTQVNLIYGGLTGVIVILIFFYIMNLCLIFGAELNYSFARYREVSCKIVK